MFIMLLGLMKSSILYTIYEYDKAAFVELFCVNKDRPQLKCHGKCKLAQMQREENEKNADDILKQLQSEIVYSFPVRLTPLTDDAVLFAAAKTNLSSYCNYLYSFLFTSKQVKPPQQYQC